MEKIKIYEMEYEIVENYKNGFEKESVTEKMTEFFKPYDYIIGDWAYGKLRLKGFCNSDNKIYKKLNDIQYQKQYIQTECAYDCSYFIMKKIIVK